MLKDNDSGHFYMRSRQLMRRGRRKEDPRTSQDSRLCYLLGYRKSGEPPTKSSLGSVGQIKPSTAQKHMIGSLSREVHTWSPPAPQPADIAEGDVYASRARLLMDGLVVVFQMEYSDIAWRPFAEDQS
jgi:hypothetical protein